MSRDSRFEQEPVWLNTGWHCPWCGAWEQYDATQSLDQIALMEQKEQRKHMRYDGSMAGLIPVVFSTWWSEDGKHERKGVMQYYPINAIRRIHAKHGQRRLWRMHFREEMVRCPCRAGDRQSPRMVSWGEVFREKPTQNADDRIIRLALERGEWLALRHGYAFDRKLMDTLAERMMLLPPDEPIPMPEETRIVLERLAKTQRTTVSAIMQGKPKEAPDVETVDTDSVPGRGTGRPATDLDKQESGDKEDCPF